MRALTLRGLAARKLRSALTAFAVVLGIALVSGTFVLTDTMNRSVDGLYQHVSAGYDAVVMPQRHLGESSAEASDLPPIPERALARVREVDGVAGAIGFVGSDGSLLDASGKSLGGGALVTSDPPKPYSPFAVVEGRAPRAPGEVAIDRGTARREHVDLGDTVRVAGDGPAAPHRVVGVTTFGDADAPGGPLALLTLAEAQRLTGRTGHYDELQVRARDGVAPAELRDRIRAALGSALTVKTAAESASEGSRDAQDSLAFVRTALLVFAGISLFVGGFMIFNTFSITVAQRSREFALLRMLGASRRQVLRSVVAEALTIGLLASVAGCLAGLGIAAGLKGLMRMLGADVPMEGSVLAVRTVVVSLLTGTAVTLVASLVPARRATRVAPIAALREGLLGGAEDDARRRTPVALVLFAVGAALLALGLGGGRSGTTTAALLGAGTMLVFVGSAMAAPKLVVPLAWLLGGPLQALRGVSGRLARENAVRNPSRTASTAAALMIGLALVTFVTIFVAGLKGTISGQLERTVRAPLVVQSADGETPFAAAASARLATVPGVAAASPMLTAPAKVAGDDADAAQGVDPATFGAAVRLRWKQGSAATLRRLAPGETVVADDYARDRGLDVGDAMRVTATSGRTVSLAVRGIYVGKTGGLARHYLVPNETLARDFGARRATLAFLTLRPGAEAATVRRAAEAALRRNFPDVEAQTRAHWIDAQAASLDPLLALFYALLSLSVLISLVGIVNTLTLSIHERTRELGLLRSIGMSRRQVRRMVRYEAVVTALIGASIGALLGTFLAVVGSRPLASEGFEFTFPAGTVVVLLVLAAVAGALAAISPARRAARLNVLEALAHD